MYKKTQRKNIQNIKKNHLIKSYKIILIKKKVITFNSNVVLKRQFEDTRPQIHANSLTNINLKKSKMSAAENVHNEATNEATKAAKGNPTEGDELITVEKAIDIFKKKKKN